MTWTEAKYNNDQAEPLIIGELGKKYDQTVKDGTVYFRRKDGELFHLIRIRIAKTGADFFVMEYMNSMEDGEAFYPEDYESLEAMMKDIYREIDKD